MDWQRFFEGQRPQRRAVEPILSAERCSRKNWGRIVFISSESGVNIPVEMIHYGVTKTAQIALGRGLAETTAGGRT